MRIIFNESYIDTIFVWEILCLLLTKDFFKDTCGFCIFYHPLRNKNFTNIFVNRCVLKFANKLSIRKHRIRAITKYWWSHRC